MKFSLVCFFLLAPGNLRIIHAASNAELDTDLLELQSKFDNFFREAVVEFKTLRDAMDKLQTKQSNDESSVDKLREELAQVNENLKATNEFALQKAGYHGKPSKGKLYSGKNHGGEVTYYNMNNLTIFSDCQNLDQPVNSVNTENSCLRIYSEPNCKGFNLMTSPGYYHHFNLGSIKQLHSVGPCTLYTSRIANTI